MPLTAAGQPSGKPTATPIEGVKNNIEQKSEELRAAEAAAEPEAAAAEPEAAAAEPEAAAAAEPEAAAAEPEAAAAEPEAAAAEPEAAAAEPEAAAAEPEAAAAEPEAAAAAAEPEAAEKSKAVFKSDLEDPTGGGEGKEAAKTKTAETEDKAKKLACVVTVISCAATLYNLAYDPADNPPYSNLAPAAVMLGAFGGQAGVAFLTSKNKTRALAMLTTLTAAIAAGTYKLGLNYTVALAKRRPLAVATAVGGGFILGGLFTCLPQRSCSRKEREGGLRTSLMTAQPGAN